MSSPGGAKPVLRTHTSASQDEDMQLYDVDEIPGGPGKMSITAKDTPPAAMFHANPLELPPVLDENKPFFPEAIKPLSSNVSVVKVTSADSKDSLDDSSGVLRDVSHDHDSMDNVSYEDDEHTGGTLSRRTGSRIAPEIDEDRSPSMDAPATDRFYVKNLDTNEKFHIQEYAQRENLDLDTFNEAKQKWKPEEENPDQEVKENPEEHRKKAEIAGWFNNLMKKKEDAKEKGTSSKVNVKVHKKANSEFAPMRVIQQMLLQCGPIWTMKFSPDSNYLAVAGSDAIVRVWTVTGSPADIEFTEQLARKARNSKGGPTVEETLEEKDSPNEAQTNPPLSSFPSSISDGYDIINPNLFRKFRGHSSDVVDLSWSPTNFLLSASLDKSVRLWHVSKEKCLGKFQHADFVTSVAFHPTVRFVSEKCNCLTLSILAS
jgi:WD40 repeat protein